MEVHQRFRRRKIRLLESGESIGNDMFFSCNSLHALESLAKFGKEPFIVTECYGFKTFTEEEISDEKRMNTSSETRKSLLQVKKYVHFTRKYIGWRHRTSNSLQPIIRQTQVLSENDCQLTPEFVRRLLDEEHLMKAGESDSFTIQLFFLWYVRIRREPENLAPFKYALEACCLDNVQTFSRRYITLEKHCFIAWTVSMRMRSFRTVTNPCKLFCRHTHGKR